MAATAWWCFAEVLSCSSSSHSSHRPVVFLHFDVALSSLTLLLLTCHCWKLLNSACCVKFYENVNLELKCLICFCLSREILRTKFISNAHVGFFCLSRVKFYAQNLNLTCPIWFFFSCQILCKTLISISLSEFCLFASCQILRTKSQASLFSAFKKSSALMVRDLCFPVQSAFFYMTRWIQKNSRRLRFCA